MALWADTVRQEAEAAHGIGYTPADPIILEDGEYGDVLDLGTELDQALPDVTALIDHLWHRAAGRRGRAVSPVMASARRSTRR